MREFKKASKDITEEIERAESEEEDDSSKKSGGSGSVND